MDKYVVPVLFLLAAFCGTILAQDYTCPQDDCSSANCQAPNCQCLDYNAPGGLSLEETPQMVLFNFFKFFDETSYRNITSLFEGRRNPNGAKLTSTLYVTHTHTDYCAARKLYEQGHELASHAIDYRQGEYLYANTNMSSWRDEMVGQRDNIAEYVGLDASEIRGMRSPYMAAGNNSMYEMLAQSQFTYDASMIHHTSAWPLTMDYKSWYTISGKWPQPDQCFPGKWEVPSRYLNADPEIGCNHLIQCGEIAQSRRILMDAFNDRYNSTKAPLLIDLDALWIEAFPVLADAIKEFIKDINKKDDVYIINTWKAIQWMKNPTPLDELATFQQWKDPIRNLGDCEFNELTEEAMRLKQARMDAEKGVEETTSSFLSGNWLIAFEVIFLVVTALILISKDSAEG